MPRLETKLHAVTCAWWDEASGSVRPQRWHLRQFEVLLESAGNFNPKKAKYIPMYTYIYIYVCVYLSVYINQWWKERASRVFPVCGASKMATLEEDDLPLDWDARVATGPRH